MHCENCSSDLFYNYGIKIAKLYIIAQIAYCMYDILLKVVIPNRIGANFSIDNLLDYLLFNQTSPDSNHLWYLIALIYVLILVRLFNDKLSIKCKIIIMSLCFLLSLVLGVYSSIFFGHALPEKYTMNFLFTGLPFFLLGELLSNVYERKNRWMRNQRFLLACSNGKSSIACMLRDLKTFMFLRLYRR